MFVWSNRLLRCRRGAAAVEFALILPVLITILVGTVEVARALIQANAIEKGLRAGAMYVARATLPVDSATQAAVENLVRRGSLDGTADYLAAGWNEAGAGVVVARLSDFTTGGIDVPVFRITATVPFVPLLPGLPSFTMVRSHEQTHIGN